MPSVGSLPESITSLTDQDLANRLLERGVALGPILPTTRRVYERKLYKLQTGHRAPLATNYPPADNDDEVQEDSPEEEVSFQSQSPHKPRLRTTQFKQFEEQSPPTPDRSTAGKPSPRRPLHPNDETPSYSSRAKYTESSSAANTGRLSKGGIPLWVKVLAILIVAVIVFLVIKNLEPDPAAHVPEITIDV